MTKDEVIALAREAEQYANTFCESIGDTEHNHWFDAYNERFAALVAAHLKSQGYRQCAVGQKTTQFCGMLEQAVLAEREECVKVCEELVLKSADGQLGTYIAGWSDGTDDCAAAIRSRT